MKRVNEYDISNGDAVLIIRENEEHHMFCALQLLTDAAFNGTTTTAEFVLSNDKELIESKWHPLTSVQDPLVLPTGEDATLLTTRNFYTRYIAVKITAGDATSGIIRLEDHMNYNT